VIVGQLMARVADQLAYIRRWFPARNRRSGAVTPKTLGSLRQPPLSDERSQLVTKQLATEFRGSRSTTVIDSGTSCGFKRSRQKASKSFALIS
jgi:hypothetical protein